jgi:hypothetical protein
VTDGVRKVVLLIIWTRTPGFNLVKGDMEVYATNRAVIPILLKEEPIFPEPPSTIARAQKIELTRRTLFGSHVFPGSNHSDKIYLSLAELCEVATDSLHAMSLLPA